MAMLKSSARSYTILDPTARKGRGPKWTGNFPWRRRYLANDRIDMFGRSLTIELNLKPLKRGRFGSFSVSVTMNPYNIQGPTGDLINLHFNSVVAENAIKIPTSIRTRITIFGRTRTLSSNPRARPRGAVQ
jgi:hypothetical protein